MAQEFTLVVQSFGKEFEYRRALLTVLSYFSFCSFSEEATQVIVFTDNPKWFYSRLEGFCVRCVNLSPDKIKTMRGKIDFLHRMKIALIDEAFGLAKGILLYSDSDTFFIADPVPAMQWVTEQRCCMHICEYPLESMRALPMPMGKTFHDFLSLIESRTFIDSNGDRLAIRPEQFSWNAGVMIFHPSHSRFIPDVYTLTDQFYPETVNHASEQYAFSIVLQNNTEIKACAGVVYHYWYKIKKRITDLFLYAHMNEAWYLLPRHQQLLEVRAWTLQLLWLYEHHKLAIQDRAVQAFNENRFRDGYRSALKALIKSPFDVPFLKDVVYHSKRLFCKTLL